MFHGSIGPIDYFVFVGGANVSNLYFFQEEGQQIRFFSKGNELSLTQDSVSYKGTGGSFCEYMFGVEKPFKDLIKREVLNRLVLFGAFLDEDERLIFSNETEGSELFHRLFLLGHAVKNYYFFVSSDNRTEPKKRQKAILQTIGKLLKRTDLIAQDRDEELLERFITVLNEPDSTVFVFKFVHRENLKFYSAFRDAYAKERMLTPEDEAAVHDIAVRHAIDFYQQERMKIDVMYRHRSNKNVVDEYRDILLGTAHKDSLAHSEFARLHRLRTLSIRNNIPAILFDTLDNFLLKDKKKQAFEEPEYLRESRAILGNLFFKDSSLKQHIITEDIVKLIRAKHKASSQNDIGFEKILLDTGTACDEYARESNEYGIFEEFSSLITYFDRYDNVRASLSRLAFMDTMELTEDMLRRLLGNKKEFDSLDENLFNEIFIKDLLTNKYINIFGRKKIKTLSEGIEKIFRGDASLKEVVSEVHAIAGEEKLYREIRAVLKEKIRDFYTPLDMKKGLGRIRTAIKNELIESGIAADIPDALFDKALLDLKTESYYLNHLLPTILQTGNLPLREDFLNNSGLDRFYIEDVEKEYFQDKGFDSAILHTLKGEMELIGIGGGERI
ncbi:MAG TPA: TIGR04442 family protein [Thermodesulfovibrionales bacterium]|nr:TIGR04442 family protein [Thermodesulfovibrionales bacterium]